MSFCRQSSRSLSLRPALSRVSSIRRAPARLLRQYANVSNSETVGVVTKSTRVIPVLKKQSEVLAEEKIKRRAPEIAQLKEEFKPYSEEEWEALAQYYTPEQLEALKEAEKTVDVEDLATQWGLRADKWFIDYTDDLAHIDPLVDHKVKPEITHAPNYRFMAPVEDQEGRASGIPLTFFDVEAEEDGGNQDRESHQKKMKKVHAMLEKLKTELPEQILAGKLHFNSRLQDWEPERKTALEMFDLFNTNSQEFFNTLRERKRLNGPEQREMLQWWKRMASGNFQPFELPAEMDQFKPEKWTKPPTTEQILEVERVVDEIYEKDEQELRETAMESLNALKTDPTGFLQHCKEGLNLENREKEHKIRLWSTMIEEWKTEQGLPVYQDIRLAPESTKESLPSQQEMTSLDLVIEEFLKSMKPTESEEVTDPQAISLISKRPFGSKDEEASALMNGIIDAEKELQGYLKSGVQILSERYDMEAELYYYKPSSDPDLASERFNEYWDILAENHEFQAMSLTEMLYRIERTTLRPEVKAELRALYVFKETFKEYVAKAILWEFVPKRQEMPRIAPEGKLSIQELLDEIDQIEMDEIKKHELLSYSHWVNTPKEEALRPMLEKAVEQYGSSKSGEQAPRRLRMLLNLIKDKMKLGLGREDAMFRNEIIENAVRKTFQNIPGSMIVGEAKNIYSRPIYSELNAEIPKIKDPQVRYTAGAEDGKLLALQRLSKQTGYSVDELKKFRVREVISHFVTNQTRKGKISSMYVLSIAGNQNGMVGIGEGKSSEVGDAVLQSHVSALRNMKPIYRYEDRTIYGEITKRVGGTTVQLSARPPGFGVRTQSLIYEIARCAGIKDLAARVGRSRNKMNTVKATMEALQTQRLPEDIAKARGMKLVDLRKVYYGRTVY